MARDLVVKVTCGDNDPERANQAFIVAAAAVAAGSRVSLWLAGEAAWYAVPGRAEAFDLPLATPIAQLRNAILAGGTLTLCSQCAARREIGPDDVIPGVRIAGGTAFAEEILVDGVQALVY